MQKNTIRKLFTLTGIFCYLNWFTPCPSYHKKDIHIKLKITFCPHLPRNRCNCPSGYKGQFCESCQDGSYHERNGGPFARCIPCSCNGHADICNPESGVCVWKIRKTQPANMYITCIYYMRITTPIHPSIMFSFSPLSLCVCERRVRLSGQYRWPQLRTLRQGLLRQRCSRNSRGLPTLPLPRWWRVSRDSGKQRQSHLHWMSYRKNRLLPN